MMKIVLIVIMMFGIGFASVVVGYRFGEADAIRQYVGQNSAVRAADAATALALIRKEQTAPLLERLEAELDETIRRHIVYSINGRETTREDRPSQPSLRPLKVVMEHRRQVPYSGDDFLSEAAYACLDKTEFGVPSEELRRTLVACYQKSDR